MSSEILDQLSALWQGALLGAALGALYDLFRVLRCRVRLPLVGPILDLVFWGTATWALFLWSQRAWGGVVRLYGAAFCFAGGALYFWLVSRWALKIGWLCADGAAFLWHVLEAPVRLMKIILRKIKENVKSIFLFLLK